MSAEQTTGKMPEAWEPLGFLRMLTDVDDVLHWGPIRLTLILILVAGTAAFIISTVRSKPSPYFSRRLFLALVPFGSTALLSFFCLYGGWPMIPPWAPADDYIRIAIPFGYPFQFGMILSGAFVVIHTLCWFRCVSRRSDDSDG